MKSKPKPSLECRLRVLAAIDYAEGDTLRARIKHVAQRTFTDGDHTYQFTWRTISTWTYRHKKHGITTLEPKPRSDKSRHRKVQVSQLAEAIHEIKPSVSKNKTGQIPKIVLYRLLLEKGLFTKDQLSQTVFYRIVRDNELLKESVNQKLRLSFAMQIERFFRGFRDRFLTQHTQFASLEDLNSKTCDWVENQYNSQYHSGIQMIPIDRFNLDRDRIQYLANDDYTDEVFYIEEDRKVSKTNVFSMHKHAFECPVDLREHTIQVRYDRSRKDRYLVYFNGQRMGIANRLNLHRNAQLLRGIK